MISAVSYLNLESLFRVTYRKAALPAFPFAVMFSILFLPAPSEPSLSLGQMQEDPYLYFYLQAHDTTKEDSQCTLRCLHYPALGLDIPRGSWRAGSHTDFSTVTLLYQVDFSCTVLLKNQGLIPSP